MLELSDKDPKAALTKMLQTITGAPEAIKQYNASAKKKKI